MDKRNTKMETIIRLKPKELTPQLIERIKTFFSEDQEIEIQINPVTDFGLNREETKEEYKQRINKAISNLESKNNKEKITLSADEFKKLTDDLFNE
mgnify:CR=1 FL=1